MSSPIPVGPKLTAFLRGCLQEWGITALTDVQSNSVEAEVPLGHSAIVCAPTSSGKTLVGELALANALSTGFNALYLVSHKALAEQRFADFNSRFSTPSWTPAITVGVSTGDREEGDVNSRLLISTYEKALGLILAGRIKVSKTVVIADELQILGEDGRGAAVETLCSLLRQRQPKQFVGLTATVQNPEELAAWMNCLCVRSTTRDVDLFQTIRCDGKLYTVKFGQETGQVVPDLTPKADSHSFIRGLVKQGLGPVLVFTETRREAAESATSYSELCQKVAGGLAISNQLELFTEPTESSQRLRSQAERRVTFHNADLTPEEKTVIEAGFTTASFDVCFATSTLAAGVNFPFRTVVFPKLTYSTGTRDGTMICRSDYRNMSGRAGRLGLHPDGRVYLLPTTKRELQHANQLVLPENDRVESRLVSLSMRRTVLSLVTARAVTTRDGLDAFFKNTYLWFQIEESNPKALEAVAAKAARAADWLLENGLIEESHSTLLPTPLGRATSISGLLPETAKQFADLLAKHVTALSSNFDNLVLWILHWVATCPEFLGDVPSRFLPYTPGHMKPESSVYLRKATFLSPFDQTNTQVIRCVHGLGLFITGEAERKIGFATGLSAGYLHRLAIDVSWILDGLSYISGASDVGCPQVLTNQISMLARRVRWGTPSEAIDVLRIATGRAVPGFGRQRVMSLIANGLVTVMDVLTAGKDKLTKLLGAPERADALVSALSDSADRSMASFQRLHLQLGQELGIKELVAKCNEALGTDYEDAIIEILRQELSWIVDKLDDGKRQNEPDIQLVLGKTELLIECKTVTRKPPLVAKEEAFAIMQKATDYDSSMRRVTLGKPDFDEHTKSKTKASTDITLVGHAVFMEGIMRVLTGRLTAAEFMAWLAEPGVTDLSRLPGTPTFAARESS